MRTLPDCRAPTSGERFFEDSPPNGILGTMIACSPGELRARCEINPDTEQHEAKRIKDAVNEQDAAQDDEPGEQDQAAIYE